MNTLYVIIRTEKSASVTRACAEIERRLEIADGYPAPTSTADELPPKNVDILWWYPRPSGRGWKAGHFEADKEVAPGFLRAGGYHWYLCGGRIGDGPTWWMYPPPDPTGEALGE
jgi:hypothetical protein